jgi:transcriptional regulator GlxA family with amidase domain
MTQSPHRVALIVFNGFQLLDTAGPASVYGAANDALGYNAYEVIIVSSNGNAVRSSCGLAVESISLSKIEPESLDSLFMTGGEEAGLRAAAADTALRDWTNAATKHANRFGSVCSGSLILAAWDLIGARKFATHWAATAQVQNRWPHLALDPDAIYVTDGPLWTSAGVTTGIDMTLAIVEADHGTALSRAIAQRLVLSARRPGWQSQFSPTLAAQGGRYADLIDWIGTNIAKPLPVETLAERAGESLRSFHRNFTAATGSTPAQFVTRCRIDRARALIVEGVPLKQVAVQTGLLNVAQLSAAFTKIIGMTANEWRVVHGNGATRLASAQAIVAGMPYEIMTSDELVAERRADFALHRLAD